MSRDEQYAELKELRAENARLQGLEWTKRVDELEDEVDRLRAGRDVLVDDNLALHDEVERLRAELALAAGEASDYADEVGRLRAENFTLGKLVQGR